MGVSVSSVLLVIIKPGFSKEHKVWINASNDIVNNKSLKDLTLGRESFKLLGLTEVLVNRNILCTSAGGFVFYFSAD